jgi:hypothetical protein
VDVNLLGVDVSYYRSDVANVLLSQANILRSIIASPINRCVDIELALALVDPSMHFGALIGQECRGLGLAGGLFRQCRVNGKQVMPPGAIEPNEKRDS